MLVIIFSIPALKAFVNRQKLMSYETVWFIVYVQWNLGKEDNIISYQNWHWD